MVDLILYVALIALAIVEAVSLYLTDIKVEYLERENWMFRQLLSEQAKLHEMSLDAYIAMLREAQRYIGR